jgi:hypothetical protein
VNAKNIATASAITVPIGTKGELEKFVKDMFDTYSSKAAVSVETVGTNKIEVKHSGGGRNVEVVC